MSRFGTETRNTGYGPGRLRSSPSQDAGVPRIFPGDRPPGRTYAAVRRFRPVSSVRDSREREHDGHDLRAERNVERKIRLWIVRQERNQRKGGQSARFKASRDTPGVRRRHVADITQR